MRAMTLNAPSTVHWQWHESDDRRRHDMWLFVDGEPIDPGYAVVWLASRALADAIELNQVDPSDGPGWYLVDDCGDVFPDAAATAPLDEEAGPLRRFIWERLQLKLATLREQGEPPAIPLREFICEPGRFRAEDCQDGVLINPELPEAFDDTPNDQRDPRDVNRWAHRPFILTHTLAQQLQSYESYLAHCQRHGVEPSMPVEQWAANQESLRQKWMTRFSSGVAYTVRCLDGGAWDRSTWWGDADTLDAALAIASTGPVWRQRGGQSDGQ